MKINDEVNINNTIGKLLLIGYEQLKNVGIESYILDTQLLLAKTLKKDRIFIITNRNTEVSSENVDEFIELIDIRKKKKPMKYIVNECEFMDINLFVREGVLVPRPDTEVLAEEVIDEIKNRGYRRICDVCSGSGAIGLSIADKCSEVYVDLYDISEDAAEVSRVNIDRLNANKRVAFHRSDLLQKAIEENKVFDVIVSNPPYIREEVIPTLMEEVKNYEPYIALCGGKDGLDFYKRITVESVDCLVIGGLLAFEIGHDQGDDVRNILNNNGFVQIRLVKDLSGFDRVVLGFKDFS